MCLSNILVYGIGNEILCDDGIGPKITSELKKSGRFKNVCFETGYLGGLEILDIIQNYKNVIFIDAIKTINGTPGTVYVFKPEDFKETLHLSSIHDISFLTALQLAKKLNLPIPHNVYIIAIEIVEDKIFSETFSPIIQEKFPEIIKNVESIIAHICNNLN
ncbi:MAG: hydrogenase maturation protease [Bacteroidales bacterium]|nr:hydrogenase maturation protease [Bacteroidales bacterium]